MSTMDINEIIDMPSEAGTESTLESEIDALSKIIDTKDSAHKLEENDEDFKLDHDDLSFTAGYPCDSEIENDKCDLLSDDSLVMKNILDIPEEIDKCVSTENSAQEIPDGVSKPDDGNLQENKNLDHQASKEQEEHADVPLVSPKLTTDKDIVIESLLNTKSLNVDNSSSLINKEYNLEPESCSEESPPVSATDTQNVLDLENESGMNAIENAPDSVKIDQVILDENEIDSIPNLLIEAKELGTTFNDNLVIDSKITETILEKNKDEQTIENASLDQPDFVNTVTEVKTSVDFDVLQKEDVKSKYSNDTPIINNTIEETSMEVDNESEAEEKNNAQQKILVEEVDSVANSIETSNISDAAIIIENKITEESIPINPISEIEPTLSRITETQVTCASNILISEDTEINLPEDFEILKDKQVSKTLSIENQSTDKMNAVNNSLVHKNQIINSTSNSQESEKNNIEGSVQVDESKEISSNFTLIDESNTEKLKIDEEIFKDSNVRQEMKILEDVDVTACMQDKDITQESNFGICNKSDERTQNLILDENIDDSKEIVSNEPLINDDQTINSNLLFSDNKNKVEDTSEKECVIEKLLSTETDNKVEEVNDNIQETGKSHQPMNEQVIECTSNTDIKLDIAETGADNLVEKGYELETVEESVQNIASSVSNKIEKDQNPTLELDEPEASEANLVKFQDNFDESKVEKEDEIETVINEKIFEDTVKHEVSEETENLVEINLSIDSDGNNSPISHDITEEQIVTDPLDKLVECENTANDQALESKTMDAVPSNILDVNQKIDQVLENEQLLNSQELSSSTLNDVEKELGSGLDILLNTEENINKETVHFANSETSNSPDRDFQSLDEKSQDSLSILNALQSEPISIDQDKENNAFESSEKENEMSLIFDESSQSPRNTESDKFVNDLYKNCVPDDTIDCDDAPVENINEYNKSLPISQQVYETNTEVREDVDLILNLEGDAAHLQDVKAPAEQLKDFLDDQNANVQDSVEISELESAVKFLQESEEQDIQNSRIIQDINVNENNPSVFVAVDDSICDNPSELVTDLPEATLDPIAISEAEIISEAAKLENERKEKLELEKQLKNSDQESSDLASTNTAESESRNLPSTDNLLVAADPSKSFNVLSQVPNIDTLKIPVLRQTKLTSTVLPEASLLDDRYKEPPKIEIPEISPPLPSTPRASLLIQKDAKQRMESPDRLSVYSESKITDTPKKDSDKQQQQYLDSENIGSPRIILKIAKSAIADCSEPRSPKSPKIRSAANSPNPDDSPGQKLGKIKLKLSRGGHPSIIPNNDEETVQWHTDSPSSASPLGMKIKLSKSGDASVVESARNIDETQKFEEGYKPETSIGMKIKLSKSGDASIVQHDNSPKESIEGKVKHKDAKETAQETSSTKKQDSPSIGMKIKLSKSGDASIIQQDIEEVQDSGKRTDSPIGMKIKLSKSGDASVVSNEPPEDASDKTEELFKRTDSPVGVRIKLAKTKSGNASIISSETIEESENAKRMKDIETSVEESTKAGIGMKIKLSKSGDASVIREDSSIESPKKSELPIGMKIKLSKTGEPSIIHTDISKKSHSDVPIESVKNQPHNTDTSTLDLHNKRKEITISPVESKKTKVDTNFKQMLPDITIQPIVSTTKTDQQKLVFDPTASSISRQQMNVINQEISITQICSLSTGDTLMGERLKNALNVQSTPTSSSPLNSDCEIIEPQPELIIVNENSNSSQDIMIIDEVPPPKSLIKVPKKRGRPRRNAAVTTTANVNMSSFQEQFELQRDPLSLDQPPLPMFQQQMHQQMNAHQLQQQLPGTVPAPGEGSERPRRTCRSQKSYAPPKRGRGRGRGKRKNDATDIPLKKQRVEQDLTAIENATTAVITLEKLPIESSPELFRALNQPTLERIIGTSKPVEQNKDIKLVQISDSMQVTAMPTYQKQVQAEVHRDLPPNVPEELEISEIPITVSHLSTTASIVPSNNKLLAQVEDQLIEKSDTIMIKVTEEDDKQQSEIIVLNEQAEMTTSRNDPLEQEHQNWLAPAIRKVSIESTTTRTDSTMSTLTVIDEETRMSAESCSRSQTPARNISVPGTSETVLVNEESQGSTATTESEKVKVKNRRMEITLDPDEGPFTVEKIAEYEWPPKDDEARPAATRAETFMIQEQISQYLGVKSFKRKYPDLKRRMVDMEERNFLRENGLVSESMCDMGLTAVSSSEVLDIMCSDFPEQYEEYRKHMREKAAKEHSKKQKELSAAANAERNRIDLAEMAMQSALNWNVGLNKARRENRRCSLDLQTFTVHMPKRPIKFDSSKRGNHYPVALIPGQYTDYYRDYTPAELRYYPLNTVLYGPMRPNERKFDSQSEGSQSDSDSDSSSDDSSSSSSEGTQDTEGSQSTMDEVDIELAIQSDIKCKMCLNHLNKSNRPEVLIQCGTCNGNVHPSCIDLTLDMVPHIRAYAWQCTDCKTCAQCHDPADEDKMLFCDMCDRGYHIYCVGLRRVPQGRWHCQECAVCANCGSKEPGGANSDRNSVAQWQHEYKKADKNTRVYVSTFCVPCSKLRGNQGTDN